jgi:hypothetical protein
MKKIYHYLMTSILSLGIFIHNYGIGKKEN